MQFPIPKLFCAAQISLSHGRHQPVPHAPSCQCPPTLQITKHNSSDTTHEMNVWPESQGVDITPRESCTTWPKLSWWTRQIVCLLPAEQFFGAIEQLFGILNNYLVAGRIVMTVSQARTRGDFWWWISMMLIRFHFGYTLNLNPHHLEVDIIYMIHLCICHVM